MITYNMSVLMGNENPHEGVQIKCNDTGVSFCISPAVLHKVSKFREQLEPYQIPPGCTAVLKIAKADKTYALTDGKIKGKKIIFKLPPQACTAIGEAKAEVNIFSEDGRRITTGTFGIEIVKEAVSDHSPDSEVYVDILAGYIKEVTTAKNEAVAAAERAEAAAEAAGKAEAGQVRAPIIGDNGNWYEWDAELQTYVDSDVNASGEPGPKGEQGEQGPQGIQGEKGSPGQPGYTPQKGIDYWTEADKAEIKAYVDEAILGGAW